MKGCMSNSWMLWLLVPCRHPTPLLPPLDFPTKAASTRRTASSHGRALHGVSELEHCHTLQKQISKLVKLMSRSPLALCVRRQVCEYRANTKKGRCYTGLSQGFGVPSPTHPSTPAAHA